MGKLVFQVTGAFAEFERTMIRQRVNVTRTYLKIADCCRSDINVE